MLIMFWKSKTEKRINQLNNTLKQSFTNVKNDTNTIFEWLNYFYQKNIEQEELLDYFQKLILDQENLINNFNRKEIILNYKKILNKKY